MRREVPEPGLGVLRHLAFMGGFETAVLCGSEEGTLGLVGVFGLRGPSCEGTRVQRRGCRVPDFTHKTEACVCRRLLTGLAEEAEEEESCFCAGGVWWCIQVKS